VLGEVPAEKLDVVGQLALRPGETDKEGGGEAAGVVFAEVALDGAAAQAGQPGDLGMGQVLALEPEDLQLLLDARVRVGEALLADGGQVVLGEVQPAHGGTLPRRFLQVSPRRLATRPAPDNVPVPPRAEYIR
jgi:hypothetical protein